MTSKPLGSTGDILKAAIASQTPEYIDMYAGMAGVACQDCNTIGGKHGHED